VDEEYLTGPDYSGLPWCNYLWHKLAPQYLNHRAASRQGQLLVAGFTLVWEVRNVGANWDNKPELYMACQEFLNRHLSDGTFDSRVSQFVCEAFVELNRWMGRESEDWDRVYKSINRVLTLAYHWCRLHPDSIAPELVAWEVGEPAAAPDRGGT